MDSSPDSTAVIKDAGAASSEVMNMGEITQGFRKPAVTKDFKTSKLDG